MATQTVGSVTLFDMVAEAVKVANDKQLAVMIAKGIDRFPDNGDRMAGNLDIWWIVRILAYRRSTQFYHSVSLMFQAISFLSDYHLPARAIQHSVNV